jgi:hypothetical protein
MPTYACANGDGFITDSDATAMDHLENNPEHKIVRIDHDPYTGNVETIVVDRHEPE